MVQIIRFLLLISGLAGADAAAAPAAPVSESEPGGAVSRSFVATCDRWSLTQQGTNIWLLAYCHAENGALWHSVLNLNHCLGVQNGGLAVIKDGNFGASCSDGAFATGQDSSLAIFKCTSPSGMSLATVWLGE
ncbi:hypothetical protein F4778DRAFT_781922 [Xylariomycetidae sp. FL2044]|nr:hypothetical protein F4778DRAFT_781922 [Xylariomycetidae sp. FL2044]